MKVKINLLPGAKMPERKTSGSVGYDLYSACEKVIFPGERELISLGFIMEIPAGFEAQIRSRSGLALKYGIFVLNSPGTIDQDYRQEVGVLLQNLGNTIFEIKMHDRIAQMVFNAIALPELELCYELSQADREGGWGSTGH